ncbi:Uncharacterised protein [uncultured archaeon]|nr:Uncharacterised protein [uncultured archaeon]
MAKESKKHRDLVNQGIAYYEEKGFDVIFDAHDKVSRVRYPTPEPPSLQLSYVPDIQMRDHTGQEVWVEAETDENKVVDKIGRLALNYHLYSDFSKILDKVSEICYCVSDPPLSKFNESEDYPKKINEFVKMHDIKTRIKILVFGFLK